MRHHGAERCRKYDGLMNYCTRALSGTSYDFFPHFLIYPAVFPKERPEYKQDLPPQPFRRRPPNEHLAVGADMLYALTNVRFWGKADSDQPLLTNLDSGRRGQLDCFGGRP